MDRLEITGGDQLGMPVPGNPEPCSDYPALERQAIE